jgi:hypothetical protein
LACLGSMGMASMKRRMGFLERPATVLMGRRGQGAGAESGGGAAGAVGSACAAGAGGGWTMMLAAAPVDAAQLSARAEAVKGRGDARRSWGAARAAGARVFRFFSSLLQN